MELEQLKVLAEDVKGWSNCNTAWLDPAEDELAAVVGHISEDGEKYCVTTVDCDQYYAAADSLKLAKFYAAANPATVLLLIDMIERLEEVPRWRDVVDELPQEAQEVLFVRGGKTVHGAWIGGIFWHSNQKCAAATWMPLPTPPKVGADKTAKCIEPECMYFGKEKARGCKCVTLPNCDRSACGDFSNRPCDNPDCSARKD